MDRLKQRILRRFPGLETVSKKVPLNQCGVGRVQTRGGEDTYWLAPICIFLIPVGVLVLGSSYFFQRDGVENPAHFFAYDRLPAKGKRVWLAGYWCVVVSYLACLAVGWWYQ